MGGDLSPSVPLSVHGEGEIRTPDRARDWSMRGALWEQLKPEVKEQRRTPTPAEGALWSALRRRQVLGAHFRRQHPFGRFVLDFYCSEVRLAIEVDGPIHDGMREYDALRTQALKAEDVSVLRFSNDAVIHSTEAVLAEIAAQIEALRTPSPCTERGQGERS